MKILALLIWISIGVMTHGCASQELPRDKGPTIAQVVKEHAIMDAKDTVPQSKREEMKHSNVTRNLLNEQDLLFPEKPNPRLIMYVAPHLSAQGIYVPGYYTAFRMYPDHPVYIP